MGYGERVEVAIAEKQQAGGQSPGERERCEDGIGQVGEGEQQRRCNRRVFCGKHTQEAQQEEVL